MRLIGKVTTIFFANLLFAGAVLAQASGPGRPPVPPPPPNPTASYICGQLDPRRGGGAETEGEVILTLRRGDVIDARPSPEGGFVTVNPAKSSGPPRQIGDVGFTAPENGDYEFEAFGPGKMPSQRPGLFRCYQGGLPSNVELGIGSGSANTAAAQSALGQRSSSLGSGFGDGAFYLEQSDEGQLNFWLSIEQRHFSGVLDGKTVSGTFGADFGISSVVSIGALASLGSSDFTLDSSDADVKSRGIGPYVLFDILPTVEVDVFAIFGLSDYELEADNFTTDFVSYGLTLQSELTGGSFNYSPFIKYIRLHEDFPDRVGASASTTKYDRASLGIRVDFTGFALNPYVAFAGEYTKYSDSALGDDSFTSPRLGFGVEAFAPNFSVIGLHFDIGRTLEDTTDWGLVISIETDF